MKSIVIVIIIAFSLLSCNHRSDVDSTLSFEIPADEATPAEKELIESVKLDIIQIAATYGVTLDLEKIPIVVSSKIGIPNVDHFSGYSGLCFWDENKKGKAILLSKKLFKLDPYTVEKRKKQELAPDTFRVLLHEIGHCYFGREHESHILEHEGKQLTIHQSNDTYQFSFMTASVMNITAGTIIPFSLKKYFVAEIIGFYKASSMEDAAQFIGAHVTESIK